MTTRRTTTSLRIAIAAAIVAAVLTLRHAVAEQPRPHPRQYTPDLVIGETSAALLCPGAHTCER